MNIVRSSLIALSVLVCTAAVATDWATCRKLGLSSVADCKRFDEDRVFRDQVKAANGLETSDQRRARRPKPSVITSCDPEGCYDDVGNRYNSGGGGVFFGPSGACQMVGNMMQCP
jgi:hypothetical protein